MAGHSARRVLAHAVAPSTVQTGAKESAREAQPDADQPKSYEANEASSVVSRAWLSTRHAEYAQLAAQGSVVQGTFAAFLADALFHALADSALASSTIKTSRNRFREVLQVGLRRSWGCTCQPHEQNELSFTQRALLPSGGGN
jgi:hypothetical protein